MAAVSEISRLIKAEVRVISLSPRLRLITLALIKLFWISQKPNVLAGEP